MLRDLDRPRALVLAVLAASCSSGQPSPPVYFPDHGGPSWRVADPGPSWRNPDQPAGALPPGPMATSPGPATPPPEPMGEDCLTPARVADVLQRARVTNTPGANSGEPQLVLAECKKRVYQAGQERFVVWDAGKILRAKRSSWTYPQPSEACIRHSLALIDRLMPFGTAIIQREAAIYPELWRDPDVGAVAHLDCTGDRAKFESIATTLHETVHSVSHDDCVYDFAAKQDVCFELTQPLPGGGLAAFARAPGPLDAGSAETFADVQHTYLVEDEQRIQELLDEVMAYSAGTEAYAVGAAQRLYPAPNQNYYNNLPLLMALAANYLATLAQRDPVLADQVFGPTSKNRAPVLTVFARGEAAYRRWTAVRPTRSYERTFWAEYQRARAAWLAAGP